MYFLQQGIATPGFLSNHRITEFFDMEGTIKSHLVRLPNILTTFISVLLDRRCLYSSLCTVFSPGRATRSKSTLALKKWPMTAMSFLQYSKWWAAHFCGCPVLAMKGRSHPGTGALLTALKAENSPLGSGGGHLRSRPSWSTCSAHSTIQCM